MSGAIWGPWALGLVLTFAIETLLRPRPAPPWRRPLAALAVHLGSWTLLFALCLLVLQRPWFAMVFIVSLQMVVVQSSNTKSTTLREPFICQDFEYFLDAIRHPRLYVPFFGVGLAIAASAAGALTIGAFLWLEPSLLTDRSALGLLGSTAALSAVAVLLLGVGLRRLPDCTLHPQQDLERLGLHASLWAYGRLARRPLDTRRLSLPFAVARDPAPSVNADALPHLVAVQSESFFDPREWHPALPHDLLPAFDAMTDAAWAQGPLKVPAWGANTVRTECAFLTGLDAASLGIHRFNPYHQLARRPVPSLASRLRALGYRTVCLHPYPASFYRRDRVMPALGFDMFLDIHDFCDNDRDGQYISDRAVADKVGTLLKESDNGPLFVFVITMENHGPLHLERPVPDDAPIVPAAVSPAKRESHDDLRVYLRHLRNADCMLARLRQALTPTTTDSRHGMLCWYGDHVPIMADLYRQLGEPSGDSRYLLWSSRQGQRQAATPQAMEVAALGMTLLDGLLAEASHRGASRDRKDSVGQTQSHQEQE